MISLITFFRGTFPSAVIQSIKIQTMTQNLEKLWPRPQWKSIYSTRLFVFTLNLYFLIWMLDSLLVRRTTVFVPCPSNTVSDHDKYIIQFLGLQMFSYKHGKNAIYKESGFLFVCFFGEPYIWHWFWARGFESSIYSQSAFL